VERCSKALTILMSFAVVCAGCDPGPIEPSETDAPLALKRIVPAEGSSIGITTARMFGTGFRSGMTLTIGNTQLVEYILVSSTMIDLTMPPHSAGVVDIVLTYRSDAVSRLAGGFTYIDYPPPTVTNMTPTRVSTEGSVLSITGTGFREGTTVKVDGAVVSAFLYEGTLYTSAPPHAAGAVDVVVTNIDGQAVRLPGALTFAPPESFDLNGDWEGEADNGSHDGTVIRFTIVDDNMVSLACGAGANILPVPWPIVVRGKISSVGGSITGRVTSEGQVAGSINIAPCTASVWNATRK
jgi:hypothetical protein